MAKRILVEAFKACLKAKTAGNKRDQVATALKERGIPTLRVGPLAAWVCEVAKVMKKKQKALEAPLPTPPEGVELSEDDIASAWAEACAGTIVSFTVVPGGTMTFDPHGAEPSPSVPSSAQSPAPSSAPSSASVAAATAAAPVPPAAPAAKPQTAASGNSGSSGKGDCDGAEGTNTLLKWVSTSGNSGDEFTEQRYPAPSSQNWDRNGRWHGRNGGYGRNTGAQQHRGSHSRGASPRVATPLPATTGTKPGGKPVTPPAAPAAGDNAIPRPTTTEELHGFVDGLSITNHQWDQAQTIADLYQDGQGLKPLERAVLRDERGVSDAAYQAVCGIATTGLNALRKGVPIMKELNELLNNGATVFSLHKALPRFIPAGENREVILAATALICLVALNDGEED